jgi:hypothetical protein
MAKLSWGSAAYAAPSIIAALLVLNPSGPSWSPYMIRTQGSAQVFSTGNGVGSGGLAGAHTTPMVAPYGDITGRGTNADKPLTPPAPVPAGTQQSSVPDFRNPGTTKIGGNGFGANDLGRGVGSGNFGGSLPTLNTNPGH